jgi:hypothetical protein
MKLLVWVSLLTIWIAGCAVTGDEPAPEQLGVTEQQVSITLWCFPAGESASSGACVINTPRAVTSIGFTAFKTADSGHPLRYFWEMPGLEISSGCTQTSNFCDVEAGNSCSDRELTVGVRVVDTVTGEQSTDMIVLYLPAVCFTFGRAVFC